jgi:tRNA 2-selenouridine synthase
LRTISIKDALNLEDVVFIDARTPKEYEEDHILDSINLPILNNEEHADIGTIYKQQGKVQAINKGFDYVGYKLKYMYSTIEGLSNKYKNIVIYCARGGMRSKSLVSFFDSLGLNIYQLEGGYKSYRNFVINYLDTVMDEKKFIVLHGLTGVGKTDMLKLLEKERLDIVDLEDMASNSGSVFGYITFDKKPPTQKEFETKIFEKLYYSKSNYIFIESESKRVGHVSVPLPIYNSMTQDSIHLLLECSIKTRVDRLTKDYVYSEYKDKKELVDCINRFRKRLGHEKIDKLIEMFNNGKYEEVIEEYLVDYYDPLYNHSVKQYTYDMIINADDINKALQKVINFTKDAMRGEQVC